MAANKKVFSLIFLLALVIISGSILYSQNQAAKVIPEEVKKAVQQTDYQAVRIKKFPVAMQCWTYRRYTFFEALEKTRALGIDYVQAYPGQR